MIGLSGEIELQRGRAFRQLIKIPNFRTPNKEMMSELMTLYESYSSVALPVRSALGGG